MHRIVDQMKFWLAVSIISGVAIASGVAATIAYLGIIERWIIAYLERN